MGRGQIGGEIDGDGIAELLRIHLAQALGGDRCIDDGDVEVAEIVPGRFDKAIDRMRLAGPEADPAARNQELAAERERLAGEIAAMLAGDPATQGLFQAAARAAVIYQAGRERTKTNAVKLIHEGRMAMHTIGNDSIYCSNPYRG